MFTHSRSIKHGLGVNDINKKSRTNKKSICNTPMAVITLLAVLAGVIATYVLIRQYFIRQAEERGAISVEYLHVRTRTLENIRICLMEYREKTNENPNSFSAFAAVCPELEQLMEINGEYGNFRYNIDFSAFDHEGVDVLIADPGIDLSRIRYISASDLSKLLSYSRRYLLDDGTLVKHNELTTTQKRGANGVW